MSIVVRSKERRNKKKAIKHESQGGKEKRKEKNKKKEAGNESLKSMRKQRYTQDNNIRTTFHCISFHCLDSQPKIHGLEMHVPHWAACPDIVVTCENTERAAGQT